MKDFEYAFSHVFCQTIEDGFLECLSQYALIILKPECLALNRVKKTISELDNLGFTPVYISIKTITQNQVFSLWKYGWENADLTRIILNCATMNWNYSTILILKNNDANCYDSCKMLNAKKESYLNPEGYSIREKIGAINDYLNFIHVSDNTEEMIRELPILFNLNEILELMNSLRNEKVLSYNDVYMALSPYIGNYEIYSIEDCLSSYILFIEPLLKDTKTLDLLYKAKLSKIIDSKVFLQLYKKGMINWDWNSILLFTECTVFIK